MGLLDIMIGKGDLGVQDPQWVRAPDGQFWRLADVIPEEIGLMGMSGVYVIWHGGVQPEWLRAGRSENLGIPLADARLDSQIREYEPRGGIWVTWSAVRKEFQAGVVSYLIRTMNPLLPDPRADASAEPIPVRLPGG
ncbi:hypothetical protein [Magnetospira sp. QH-2]|uniref:hypothetical protein n=1 Tax=Magnetospira sp. (strain QH-2) TaxID=1288970 RepID=UPI0003E80D62|nr:hypothetical protein [Magnetospira sp. QH-2]CCQ74938.1 protein of unknown function [Magnetospira sp. QH-2]